MPGLFATENVAALEHFFENIAVADVGARERNIFAGEDTLETQIRHGRGDDAIAGKLALRLQITRDSEQHTVAVDDGTVRGDEEGAVGIAIEGHSECGLFGRNALLQFFEVQGTATRIDVAAVGLDSNANDVAAKRREDLRTELVCGAIGAVENNTEPFERGSRDDPAAQKVEILVMKRSICLEIRQGRGHLIGAVLEDVGFDFFLDGVRELHAFVGEELDAIVLIGIVGSRDNDADVKVIVTDKTGDAGSGQNSSKGNRSAALEKTCRDNSGDVRAGLAGVCADECVGGRVIAVKILGNGEAESKESGVVERRSSGDAANTVRTKKLSRHRVRGRWALTDKKFSTAIRKSRGAAWRMC